MSQEILNSVLPLIWKQNVEGKFEEQLSQTECRDRSTRNEAKSNMENIRWEVYKAELKEKSTKESRVRSERGKEEN